MTASEGQAPGGGGAGPLDRLLDLVFYAPLGLLLRARDEVPKLASHGRDRVATQAPLAKMVGQIAVAQGRRQVESLIERLPGSPPAPSPEDDPGPPGPSGARGPVLAPDDVRLPVPAPENSPEPMGTIDVVETPEAADLPIPGYDTLSASQVVQRLPGLSADELEAVRAYEQAGRGRKTVLLRVAQLRTAS
ncbi:MAG: hypothetical protein ACRD2W_14085 [Acidimicrobiales bacterium]